MSLRREAELQYLTSDPLKVRIETHQRYSESYIDLDLACTEALALSGGESILDAGCGPGLYLSHLRSAGHTGRLVGLDLASSMIAEAATSDVSIEWVVGDVGRLPFTDGEFDRVTARHMLYYVEDIEPALRELARVTSPDGLFLATTNAEQTMPLLDELYLDLLHAFGIPPRRQSAGAFRTEKAVALLQRVWPHVNETILDNAFVFTTPEPIVRYTASLIPSLDDVDTAMQTEMARWLEHEAATRLRALGGVWRDAKIVGLYVCHH